MTGGPWASTWAEVLLAVLVTTAVAAIFGIMLWETIRLWLHQAPITDFVRAWEGRIGMHWLLLIFFVAGAVVGFLVDHFSHY